MQALIIVAGLFDPAAGVVQSVKKRGRVEPAINDSNDMGPRRKKPSSKVCSYVISFSELEIK